MQEYTLGFLFAEDKTRCLMVQKKKPKFMAGLWNGIGGSLNPDESEIVGMCREADEETKLDVVWVPYAVIHRPQAKIHCFWSSVGKMMKVPKTNDVGEQLDWLNWSQFRCFETVPMLIQLALLMPENTCDIYLGDVK